MPILHIANTDLEYELIDPTPLPLEVALKRNPIIHQLQFLPITYAELNDGIGVTDLDPDFKNCYLLSSHDLPFDRIESWGPSLAIAKWAEMRRITYEMPPWDLVKEVNSKAFSFMQCNPLPGAHLVHTLQELDPWIQKTNGVLKTCFGLSGRGHLLLPATKEKIHAFASREFQAKRSLIAEPWVDRKLDFSTQWILHKDQSITYVGSTIIDCDSKGQYLGNIVGEEEKIFGAFLHHLQEHKEVAHATLNKMAAMGFFGNVGFDAMIWGDGQLHPIVEINARKTMGYVALQIRKRLFSNQTIQVNYVSQKRENPLLPRAAGGKTFNRNLYVTTLA